MKMKAVFVLALIGLFCVGNLWAQYTTTDGRHFTLPPQPATNDTFSAATILTTQVPADAKKPVVLNFDNLPAAPWVSWNCGAGETATAAHGILTIASPPGGCFEYDLWHPESYWHHYVSNQRGWVVEASLRVDPSTDALPFFDGAVMIWMHDHTNLVIVGFNPNELLLSYPEHVSFPMNTTDAFHVYRIETRGKRMRIFVDGNLAIDHTFSISVGLGSDVLMFGDGNLYRGMKSLTQWDYFSYEVFPNPPLNF
jgi:hypothetical protein